MAEHTLAWCAGLWEGEGWVTFRRRNGGRSFDLAIGIVNTDVRLFRPFVERWGGSIRPKKAAALSKKQAFIWTRECRAAEAFLRDIQPFVVGAKADKVAAGIAHREAKARVRARSGAGAFVPMEIIR